MLLPRTAILTAAAVALAGPASAASLDACVAGIRAELVKSGVSAALVNKALGNVPYDEKAVRFSRTQPEYVTPIWDYMTFLVDAPRVADGKAMMKKYAGTLSKVEQAYGVDRYVLAALWGVESDYGREKGEFVLPHALANVACAGKNPAMFKGELLSALRLVQKGDLDLDELQGSWAGAFGQTQFIPSTYARIAVDFDGDGKRDLIKSVPDALASTASYLKKSGWQQGLPWGFEVKIPKGYAGPSKRTAKAPIAEWKKRGVTLPNGKPLAGGGSYGLILPAGKNGPAFLVSRNFDALYAYNASIAYALAIGHLSDRLKGGGGFTTPWPTDDIGLTRAERKELQELLTKKGFYSGPVDGRIGPLSNKAIKAAEKAAGLPETGRPNHKVLKWLEGG
ncbi:MAG: lytic murein transglycosylase [Hyphomicrobiales bacterium]